uniref:Uncharacterized protein n=1 Tax=Romanomermis culicivorax TaxID=13658 RepID=A0A915I012_ROMCU
MQFFAVELDTKQFYMGIHTMRQCDDDQENSYTKPATFNHNITIFFCDLAMVPLCIPIATAVQKSVNGSDERRMWEEPVRILAGVRGQVARDKEGDMFNQ